MPAKLDTDDTALAAALRERGGRVTPQRLHVFRTLRRLDRHASAEEVTREVEDDLPGISVPTVYATLDLLADLGFARRVTVAKGATLYDPRTDDHHHIVCTSCGKVEDLETPLETERALRAARAKGFAAERVELLVTGLCADCRAAAP